MIVPPGRFRVSARSSAASNQHDLSQDGEMKQTIDEIRRLRGCINDLISVQALPAMWTGQEPAQIVSTLLDVLIGMLRLDFAYARLKDPDGESPIELLRLPQSRNLTASTQAIGHVLQPWLGDAPQKWPLLVRNPIGDGDVSIVPLRLGLRDKIGVIVAGSQRADFPGETERLLLSVAANQAAIGLQEARLLNEQKRVAEELDQRVAQRTSQLLVANEELEKEIAERKRAEEKLRASQAFLTEAQSISHTGSFGWRVSSEDIFWSEETFRIFQYDPTTKPSVALVFQRTHPDDVAFAKQAIERASQDEKDFDFEHRLLMLDGSIKHVRVVGHAERGQSGELEFVGAVMDVTAAREAEQQIRHDERELRTTIETIPAMVLNLHPDGSIDFVSQSWLDYLGLSLEEMSGGAWTAAIHPEDRDQVLNNWQVALAAGEPFEIEVRHRRADGKYRWFLVRCVPLRDEKGNIVKWYGTHFDIEDRKRAEEKLQRSEAYLAEAQKLTHTASWARDVATEQITHSSEENARLFGFDPERGVPSIEEFRQRVHPEDRARARETYERAEREQTRCEVDYRAVLPDGTIRYHRAIGHPVFNAAGGLVEYIGTTMDVTERKRADEKLRRSEAYLAEAQRLTHTGSWALSVASGEPTHSSEEHLRLLGFDPESDAPSMVEFRQRVYPQDRESVVEKMDRAISERSDFEADFRVLLPDGTIKFLHAIGHPVVNAVGDLVEYMGTSWDVTERKQAEEALLKARSELAHVTRVATLGEMTASISHEINQPLGAMVNNANACLRWLAASKLEEVRRSAMLVVADGHRAGEIIGRIRALAQKAPPRKDWFDINKAINEVIV